VSEAKSSIGFPELVLQEDFVQEFDPLTNSVARNELVVGSKIRVIDQIDVSNNLIIKLLEAGSNAIFIDLRLSEGLSGVAEHLLHGVELSLIKSFFWLRDDQNESFRDQIGRFLPQQSVYLVGNEPGQNQAIKIEAEQDAVAQIGCILRSILAVSRTVEDSETFEHPILLPLSDHYFENLAKLRAVKILHNLMQSNLDNCKCNLQLFGYDAKATADHADLISMSSRTVSALSGNADGVFMGPWVCTEADLDMGISSVHSALVMQYETDLLTTRDPAAGSYFFEKCTDQLAKAAWREFKINLS